MTRYLATYRAEIIERVLILARDGENAPEHIKAVRIAPIVKHVETHTRTPFDSLVLEDWLHDRSAFEVIVIYEVSQLAGLSFTWVNGKLSLHCEQPQDFESRWTYDTVVATIVRRIHSQLGLTPKGYPDRWVQTAMDFLYDY